MKSIQLVLDLPQFICTSGSRVLLLHPHPDAGKTGRVNHRIQFKTGLSDYFVNLPGKSVSATRSELHIIQ